MSTNPPTSSLTTTTDNLTVIKTNVFEDPVLYVYIVIVATFGPAFLSDVTLLYQIWKYQLAHTLSANLFINIGCWITTTLIGLVLSGFVWVEFWIGMGF